MALIPLSLARRLATPLQPLRRLCAAGWLREADVDWWMRLLHPALRLNRIQAQVETRRWVADDMLALTQSCNSNARRGSTCSCTWSRTACVTRAATA